MVSGSADEHIRIWDMEQKIISKYISIQRPSDSDLLKYQNIDKDNMPKYASEKKDVKDDPNDPMRGVKRKIQSVFLTSFAFMGPLIFTGYEDGLICEWAIETGALNFPMLGHSNRVNHLLAADTHDFIYSSSNDCTVR
jgi:WD40 repeat protein